MKTLLLLLLSIAGAIAGEETVTHHITGLFSRDREADLRVALEKLPDVKLMSLDFAHAEAAFAYDPAIAFKDTKAEKIVERFDELLRNVSHHTLGVAPPIATPKDKLAPIEIRLQREINPRLFSEEEFRTKLKSRDRFLTSVVRGARIMIVGTIDEP